MQNSHVFISYSSKEVDTAIKVCNFLENNGIGCWIAPRNVDAGSNYASQIVSAIKKCEILILLASESTNGSGHVSNEVSLAFDNKKIIIPFKLEDFNFTDEFLYYLGRKHWIEAHSDFNEALAKLKETVLSLTDAFGVSMEEMAFQASQGITQSYSHDSSKSDFSESFKGSELNSHAENPRASGLFQNALSRNDIVNIIKQKSEKYQYNLLEKFEEDKDNLIENASVIFSETMEVYRYNKVIDLKGKYIDFLVDKLSNVDETSIQIEGLPGSAKNMLLQIVFYKMLENFQDGRNNALPVYVSSAYFEKLPYNPQDIRGQMHSFLEKEFHEYFGFLEQNPDVKPVLFVEGIRQHIMAKISPEVVIFDLWRKFGNFNRICSIDVGLIKNRTRLKKFIPLSCDSNGYTIVTNSLPIDDKDSVCRLIRSVFNIYKYQLEIEDEYKTLKIVKIPTVDVFLIRLFAKEMLSLYGDDDVNPTDIYEKIALAEFYGDEEKLLSVAEELYDYLFDPAYIIDNSQYNASLWVLPNKHSTYLEFMIARYFVMRIEQYAEYDEQKFFGTMLTEMANHFVTSFLKSNYQLQEKLLQFINDNYEIFDIRQKSNAMYWLGRITNKSLSNEAITILTKEFTKYKALVKNNNKSTLENCDNHFLFRSICTGMLFHGQANIMDEYLCVVVTNDIANAINRGASIEYFGESYEMAANDSYYLDTDLSAGERALKILIGRIETLLFERTDKFVENYLVIYLTIVQARIQNIRTHIGFDIKPYVKKALYFLEVYRNRPQNVVSDKLMFYFKSVEDDFSLYIDNGVLDIGPMIYNKYRRLKQVKRYQWVSHNIDDPESVSEHTFSAWLMGMLFLPEEHKTEGYSKKEILDMLLVHDLAEASISDAVTSNNNSLDALKIKNEVMKKLFLKGTYPDLANMTYFYNVWTGYYNGLNSNARTARDINLLQSVYTFCEYYCLYPDHYENEEVLQWLAEKKNLKTELGYQLFNRLIENNRDFVQVYEVVENTQLKEVFAK